MDGEKKKELVGRVEGREVERRWGGEENGWEILEWKRGGRGWICIEVE